MKLPAWLRFKAFSRGKDKRTITVHVHIDGSPMVEAVTRAQAQLEARAHKP